MNKQDEYWFWVMKAISEPNQSDLHYFFDKEINYLFALTMLNETMCPFYRNSITANNEDTKKKMEAEISKIKDSNSCIIILPRLSFQEKKTFLNEFISKVDDLEIKHKLQLELDVFSTHSKFEFMSDLKELSQSLAFSFAMDKGQYLSKEIKDKYEPLGVTELTTILW